MSGGTRVYVGGLNEDIKKEDLEREFDRYGKLNSVWVALNPPGFAFIEFENSEEAEDACSAMNGTEIMGVTLKVELSKKRDGPRKGGNFRGGRGGGGGGGGYRDRNFGGNNGGYRSYGGNSYGGGGGRGGREFNRNGGGYGGGGGGNFRSRSPMSRY